MILVPLARRQDRGGAGSDPLRGLRRALCSTPAAASRCWRRLCCMFARGRSVRAITLTKPVEGSSWLCGAIWSNQAVRRSEGADRRRRECWSPSRAPTPAEIADQYRPLRPPDRGHRSRLQNGIATCRCCVRGYGPYGACPAMVRVHTWSPPARGDFIARPRGDIVIERDGPRPPPAFTFPDSRCAPVATSRACNGASSNRNLNNADQCAVGPAAARATVGWRLCREIVRRSDRRRPDGGKSGRDRSGIADAGGRWLHAAPLRLPYALFAIALAPAMKIDPQVRSSMREDLERRRRTEI